MTFSDETVQNYLGNVFNLLRLHRKNKPVCGENVYDT